MEQVIVKKRKKRFFRQEYHIRKRLQRTGWRKPRGFHSKMRKCIKSKLVKVKIGYGNPKVGEPVAYVSNLNELKATTAKAVMIRGSVGAKKKVELINEAKKMGLRVMNVKDTGKYLESIKKKSEARKAKRAERSSKKMNKKEKKKAGKEAKKEEKVEPKQDEKETEGKKSEEQSKKEEKPVEKPKKAAAKEKVEK